MLTAWGMLYIEHLKKFRPKLYRQLKASGDLEAEALDAQEQAKDLVVSSIQEGMNASEAQSLALRTFILLPSEEQVPDLSRNPFAMG